MGDFKKEWFSKSQVDYFPSFLNLWLSCNSWYNFHYTLGNDRDHINKVKSDFSKSNKIYIEFKKLLTGGASKDQKSLFGNIEMLHYALAGQTINTTSLIKPLHFEMVLLDYSQKAIVTAYIPIIIKNAKTQTGKLKSSVNGIDLGDIVLINDPEKIFAGLFEIIYQVRCLLVHGHLDPTEENHEIIKYCYLILFDLMKPFCV